MEAIYFELFHNVEKPTEEISRLRHEKVSGHMPQERIDRNEVLYDAELKMFKCSFPNCSVLPKRKLNLERHMTTCQAIKKWKHSKLTCPYCKLTFCQKFYRDRHARNINQEYILVFVHDVTEADQNTFNNFVDFNSEEPYENVETIKSHAFPVNENECLLYKWHRWDYGRQNISYR